MNDDNPSDRTDAQTVRASRSRSILKIVFILVAVAAIGGLAYLAHKRTPSLSDDGETLLRGGVRLNGSGVVPDGVKTIGESAFEWRGSLTSVVIPEGVKEIGASAFAACDSLTSVSIPASVEEIGRNAFGYCGALTRIDVAEANPYFKSVEGALLTKNGETLICGVVRPDGSAVIPGGVKTIGYGAFDWRRSSTSVVIPEGVKEIGDYAFYNCDSLTSVSIPASVETIGEVAFWGCGALTRIDVAEGNPNFKSVDGALLTKDGETELRGGVRPDGSAVIPGGVKTIGESAFDYCDSLTSVSIPASVEEIGEGAFHYCDSLTSVSIPASVERIGERAFDDWPADLTLHGAPGSAAERWAKENGIRFEPLETTESTNPISNPEPATSEPASDEEFDDETAKLGAVRPDGSAVIPDGTTRIPDEAFAHRFSPTSVSIPEGVKTIATGRFPVARR